MQVCDLVGVTKGDGPLVATAIHDGHLVRPELSDLLLVSERERLREEDPYTGAWTTIAPNRIVGLRSRFEFDLNRPRDRAIYRVPEDAWGLELFGAPLTDTVIRESLSGYDLFYSEMKSLFDGLRDRHGAFVVLDLHSYNHRREGPDEQPADPERNPEVNIGTGWIDREYWAPLVDRFILELRNHAVLGRTMDVRENVKFRGGAFPRWIAETYRRAACPIAVEFKKTFMDEWTGLLADDLHTAIGEALEATTQGIEEELLRIVADAR